MTLFPTLTAMGVTSLDEISRYTLHTRGEQDELKIYYDRAEDSIQPHSKKFHFSRPEADTGDEQGGAVSPALLNAIGELNNLTKRHQRPKGEVQQELLAELNRFESVVAAKIDELKRNLDGWT